MLRWSRHFEGFMEWRKQFPDDFRKEQFSRRLQILRSVVVCYHHQYVEHLQWFCWWVVGNDCILIVQIIHELPIPVNQTVKIEYTNTKIFDKPANFSYHCNREQQLNTTGGLITVSKLQFEAFKVDNSQKFSNAKDCDSNISPDIVPIAVGISLIALIVVVLVAYIVGRRRQQARGYLNIM